MKGNVAEMVQETKKVSCQRHSRWVFASTYKADFGFSVFVNRLKNQIVSEGPSGLKLKEMLQRWFRNKKRSVVSDIVGGFCQSYYNNQKNPPTMSLTTGHFWFLNHRGNISFHLSPLGTSETLYFLSYNATILELVLTKLSL